MDGKISTKEKRRLRLIRDGKLGWVFIIIGVFAFIAFVYAGREYNNTVIQFKYLLSGSVVAGLIIGTFILKYSQRNNGKSFNLLKHYLWSSAVYGSLLCGLFFWTNIHLSKANQYAIKAPILARLETFRYSHIYVTVHVDGVEKDIPIPNIKMTDVNNSNFVILTFQKGFWGFPFILDKKLTIN